MSLFDLQTRLVANLSDPSHRYIDRLSQLSFNHNRAINPCNRTQPCLHLTKLARASQHPFLRILQLDTATKLLFLQITYI